MSISKMKDGVYTSASRGHFGDIPVRVTVTGGVIAEIEVLENLDTPDFTHYPSIKIPDVIKKYQTLDVDAITGATFSSRAILKAVTDCVRQAGGDVEAMRKAPGPQKDSDRVIEKTCDVCVIGSGASGSCAAVVAAEAGASVIVLETAAYNGGISVGANCLLAVNSDIQLEAGVRLDMAEVFDQMMHWNHFRGNGRLISRFLRRTASTVDWINNHGVEIVYSGSEEHEPVFDCAVHFKEGFRSRDIRRAQLKRILDTVYEYGGEVIYEARAKALIMENGAIAGVRACLDDGSSLIVRSKAVVVATGCYDGNKELADKYFPDKARFCMPAFLAQGDGLKMCIEAGGDTKDLGARVLHLSRPERCTAARSAGRCDTVMQMASFPANVFLNYKGRRYLNEWLVHNSLGCANAGSAQGSSSDFLVLFCESTVSALVEKGPLALGVDAVPGGFTQPFLEPGYFDNMRRELEAAIEVDMCVSGETIEELAEKLLIDPPALAEEIERYNSFCEKGCDDDFFKSPELLHPMDKGPYYALRGTSESYGSVGGIRTDDELRVLTAERDPIPGLYAAGACVGGVWGNDSYGIILGSTNGWAYNSGIIAGEFASGFALDK